MRASWFDRLATLFIGRRKGGIAARITRATLALTLAGAAGIGAMSFGAVYWALWQNVQQGLDNDVRLLRQGFDDDLNNLAFDLAKLATNSFLIRGLSSPAARREFLQPLLDDYLPPVSHLVTLVIFDASRQPIASNVSGDLKRYRAQREADLAAAAGHSIAAVQADAEGRPLLYLAYPLIAPKTGQQAGILLGIVRLDSIFEDNVDRLDPATTSHAFLIGTGGTWPTKPSFTERIWKATLTSPLDTLNVQVRIGRDKAAAFAPLRTPLAFYCLFTLLLLLAALLLALRTGKRLAAPIAALSHTASQIATSGSFDIKARVIGRDEVAALAEAFNAMLERLRDSHVRLHAHQRQFMALVENSPDLIARFDPALRCVYVNGAIQSHFGLLPANMIGRTAHKLGIQRSAIRSMTSVLHGGGERTHEYEANDRYFEARFVPEHDERGKVVSLLAIVRDISSRRRAEESLRLANRAIESSDIPIIIVSCQEDDYPVKYVNPAFERVTGYATAEAIGRNCRFLQGDDRAQPELELLRDALRQRHETRVVLRNYRKDGSRFLNELTIAPVLDAKGTVTHFVGEINDVTHRLEQEAQLRHKATHDALTGLPNRNLLTDLLVQAISYAQRYQRMVVVAFLDLDKFKYINDTLGHDAGDQLLKIVAQRLRDCVRDSDTVARLGGDEFVLVLYDQANEDVTYHTMQRLLGSIAQPVELGGREFTVTGSIGFAIYPQDGDDAETLLKNADAAMYRAKELGRNNFQFYTPGLNKRISERLALESGLRRALTHDEFVLHYQPRVDLHSGKITGVEALIRWHHPQQGLVEPDRFIPLAEELGLIHEIGDWVLRSACRQQLAWQREGLADLPVAVNIAATQFLHGDFPGMIDAVLRDTGMKASRLELEISESMAMRNPQETLATLRALKEIGVRIAIDDFGTGYSNLHYVKQLRIDSIKLDRSFVRDIVRNPEDMAISNAVISMAHSLRARVTAAGVESDTQLALLADQGCDEMQGFRFSPAMPAEQCAALLRKGYALPEKKLGKRLSPRTLLLVDDEPRMLAALERALRHIDCEILKSPSALDAFDLMATQEVGVILCDQRMPGMTGTEFFARVRHMYPATVRMILSGYADIDAVTDAINIGAVYKFLNKPWNAEALSAIVVEAFAKYERDRRQFTEQAWQANRRITA